MNHLSRAVACAALAAAALMPATANAWWHGGVFIGVPPIVVGPPVYPYPYPYAYPPGYYYPPAPYPAYPPAGTAGPQSAPDSKAPQMSQANTPYGATCYAGFYTCAAVPQSHVGAGCTCPGIGAPSFGSVH